MCENDIRGKYKNEAGRPIIGLYIVSAQLQVLMFNLLWARGSVAHM